MPWGTVRPSTRAATIPRPLRTPTVEDYHEYLLHSRSIVFVS